MNEPITAYLLNKYLQGDCTPEEEAVVKEWYNSFEADTDHISAISEPQKQAIKDRLRNNIQARIASLNEEPVFETQPQVQKSNVRTLIYTLSGVAAAVIIFFGIYFNKQTAAPDTADNVELVNVTNTTKSIYEQVLSDGSHVWLSPGAQLKFSKKFTGNTREVTMTGESFFEITKNPAKPFIIYSNNMVTKVWGTSFRVRDSKNLSFADVSVVTGKVSVKLVKSNSFGHNNKALNEVMIYPNQQVTYSKKNNELKEKFNIDIKELHIWKKVNISFDNATIESVMPVLNKRFEVNIHTADTKLNAYLLNADFNDLNLPQIMELLKKTLNVSYEVDGTDILLVRN
ncbi:FecR family protein [Mucilaginibacter pineti]|uniref:FecR family protein n=1 Tax=Mucilaginibacter pineti TaxID=1391627 RepID=A0A1G6X9U6_9SPHI|nr:FecR family protein [Mucilaginibacter pineti]SDD74117.1 FecR family protein [Mucilaginibacter pineti]